MGAMIERREQLEKLARRAGIEITHKVPLGEDWREATDQLLGSDICIVNGEGSTGTEFLPQVNLNLIFRF